MGWIDVHHHLLPPRLAAEQRDEILYFARDPAVLDWTPGRALEQLDRFGIDTAYVSLGVPGAPEPLLARGCNVSPPACRGALNGYPDPFLEFPFDTTRTVTSLLYAGAFTRWPGISFIFSHGGGAVAMLAQRIVALAQMSRSVEDPIGQLSRRYVDTVTTTSAPAFGAVDGFFGPDRILFGSDYPYVPIEATAGGLRSLDLGPAALEAIGSGNVLRLLPAR